ncbi:MAG: sigma-70 family RNA polymerase sigma factor [Chloroflexota bacterium]
MRPFENLSVQELVVACQSARANRCRTESDLSYELFCRAFDCKDQEAWSFIQNKYQPMVKSWIFKTASNISDFDADDLAQIAYTKFWRNLSRSELSLTAHFEHLGSILKYLNQCATTTAIDFLRKKQRLERLDEKLQVHGKPFDTYVTHHKEACDNTLRMRSWMSTTLTDPVEKLLLKLLFEYDLKPAEIVNKFPQHFPDKSQVRRVRERVIKRAKRALVQPTMPMM